MTSLLFPPSVCCVRRLTGYGIHHCFARSMMEREAEKTTMFTNFYAHYYTMAGIAVASCMALCPAVGLMGRRGGLLMFMIITALASLLQLGLLNREYTMNQGLSNSHSWRAIPLRCSFLEFIINILRAWRNRRKRILPILEASLFALQKQLGILGNELPCFRTESYTRRSIPLSCLCAQF